MACLNFSIAPVPSAVLTAAAVAAATLAVTTTTEQPALTVGPTEQPALAVTPAEKAALLAVTPVQQATLTLGEVCTVSNDTIVVLAASDGPLRTRDGGYILLDPATNPPGA